MRGRRKSTSITCRSSIRCSTRTISWFLASISRSASFWETIWRNSSASCDQALRASTGTRWAFTTSSPSARRFVKSSTHSHWRRKSTRCRRCWTRFAKIPTTLFKLSITFRRQAWSRSRPLILMRFWMHRFAIISWHYWLQEFFEIMNKHRNSVVEGLVQKYQSISPLLLKMESLVVNTNTGRSPHLRSYYTYWERRIYFSLHTVFTSMRLESNILS